VCWQSQDERLTDLLWDGRRLIGADARSRRVVVVGPGAETLLAVEGFRPSRLAADGVGGWAALDERRGIVMSMRADGRVDREWRIPPETAVEVERIALGADGTFHAVSSSDGTWVRRP
jgi:hypothetical protein